MRLILVNTPDLTIIVPAPKAQNAYLSFVIPATTVASIVITPVTDPNMTVDNMNVVTQLQITIAGANGQTPYEDSITVFGQSTFTTENGQGLILQEQTATGLSGSTVTVTSCGQTSTFAD